MNPLSFVAKCLFGRTLRERGPALTFARLCTSRHLQDLQLIAFLMSLLLLVTLVMPIYDFVATSFSMETPFSMETSFVSALVATAAAAAAVLNWTYQNREQAHRCCGSICMYDSQLSDLEPLDVNVVTYVTEFYTYRKTMMDFLRAIAAAKNVSESASLMSQMIYMQFLMYESGRLAVKELIEFEPNQAESLVNILCSELVTYVFLQTRYKDDYRGKRLHLRCEQYQKIVPELYDWIMSQHSPTWIKAQTTAPELIERYKKMCSALRLEPAYKVTRPQHGYSASRSSCGSGARNPGPKDPNARNCRPETGARQPKNVGDAELASVFYEITLECAF